MNVPRWDIFCHVVDNFGDIGVCWRLARQLAEEYSFHVRLWVDDLSALAKLYPPLVESAVRQQVGEIEVCHWQSNFPAVDIADVVIEAFACELPASYVAGMQRRSTEPIWINLEYLSAESWVEDCHQLPSVSARSSLKKYFYFPGFTPNTGGLLRERNLLETRHAFDASAAGAFWKRLGITSTAQSDELRVSLFCYENPSLPRLLECWADGPTEIRLLATPGAATRQVAEYLGEQLTVGASRQHRSLTVQAVPFLSHGDYDRLLWACDLNFVRGEDSFVRAQWAERPFVWQIYPQSENTHLAKLDAFLNLYLDGFSQPVDVRTFWNAWNCGGDIASAWQGFAEQRGSLEQHGKEWSRRLDRWGNLADNLVRFVRDKKSQPEIRGDAS